MEEAIKFYSIPNNNCGCRDENGDLTKIGKYYKKYYDLIKTGKNGAEALNKMNIMRTCCRIKFLSLAVEPMIDRSSDRFVNHLTKPNIRYGTRELEPKILPPDFPTLN